MRSDAAASGASGTAQAAGACEADAAQGWDLPEVWARFSQAAPDGRQDSHLAITGMHCASCSLMVEQALRSVAGVDEVSVNAASQMARVRWRPDVARPSQWVAALARAGYGAVPFDDLQALQLQQREHRVLLWRWLVAGFCMMQVMMYAVPAYTAAPGEMEPAMLQLLRWASWVLTLPVLLFSSQPFFAGAWAGLRQRRITMDTPVALGIAIAFAASTAGTFDAQGVFGREVWFDSVTMFVFFLLSARLLEQRLRARTLGALQAMARRLPATALRAAGTAWQRVAIASLCVGDRLQVQAGEVFPADGTVLSGRTAVDEALLTGESQPEARGPGDAVIAGSHNLSGVVEVRVDRLGADTRYAAIVRLMREAATAKPAIAQLADRMAQPFLWAVVAASAMAAAWWWPTDPSHAVAVAVAVLIVTCPCALSLATPAALLTTAGALARRGVLVRRLAALEDACRIDHVLFDKTGTLTHGRMQLAAVQSRAGLAPREALQMAAALARHSRHPVSRALVDAAALLADDRPDGQETSVPSVPVFYGVVEVPGQGIKGWRVMADEALPAEPLRLGTAAFAAPMEPLLGAPAVLDATPGADLGAASRGVQGGVEGLRVHLSDAAGWLASFTLSEQLRDDAASALQSLRQQGLTLELLSGDRAEAARALAQQLPLSRWAAPCLPADKLARVQALQGQRHAVAMVGDGINDAPVLARADVSVALGDAAPMACAQADVLVPGGQLDALALLVSQARRARRVVRENLAWAAVYNLVAVPLAVAGWMPAWLAGLGMAASSLLVVLNAARLGRLPAPSHA
jgi:Cu2+-exporting ATPase